MNSNKMEMVMVGKPDNSAADNVVNNKELRYIIVKEEGSYIDSYEVYREFEKEVNGKLKQGWKLCGGVSVGNIGSTYFSICQAMIKEEE